MCKSRQTNKNEEIYQLWGFPALLFRCLLYRAQIFRMREKGIPIEVLELQRTITAFSWEPSGMWCLNTNSEFTWLLSLFYINLDKMMLRWRDWFHSPSVFDGHGCFNWMTTYHWLFISLIFIFCCHPFLNSHFILFRSSICHDPFWWWTKTRHLSIWHGCKELEGTCKLRKTPC